MIVIKYLIILYRALINATDLLLDWELIVWVQFKDVWSARVIAISKVLENCIIV